MAGRGRDQNRDVLDRITAVLETLVQECDVEPAEYRGLMAFRKNHRRSSVGTMIQKVLGCG